MRPPSAVFTALLGVAGLNFADAVTDDWFEQVYPVPPPGKDVLARSLAALELSRPSSAVRSSVEETGELASSTSEVSLVNFTVPWYMPPAEGAYSLHLLTLTSPVGLQSALDSEIVADLMMRKKGAQSSWVCCRLIIPTHDPYQPKRSNPPTSSPQITTRTTRHHP